MNKNFWDCTDGLFARPSFVSGASRVLDLFGTFDRYNSSPTPAAADARAIASDWAVVGKDMKTAIEQETCKK